MNGEPLKQVKDVYKLVAADDDYDIEELAEAWPDDPAAASLLQGALSLRNGRIVGELVRGHRRLWWLTIAGLVVGSLALFLVLNIDPLPSVAVAAAVGVVGKVIQVIAQ